MDERPYFYGPHNEKYDAVVEELALYGLTPYTKIIWENLEDECTGTYEKIRISYQKSLLGKKLTNKALGGFGLNVDWSDEMRAQHSVILSEVKSAFYQTEEGTKLRESQSDYMIDFYKTDKGFERIELLRETKNTFYQSEEGQKFREKMRKEMPDKKNAFYQTEEGTNCRLKHSARMSGSNHPRATINDATAQAILDFNGTHADAAKKFGVSKTIAFRIRNRLSWHHLTHTNRN
jgi:hypothetical protein